LYAIVAIFLLAALGYGIWYAFFRTVRDPDGAVAANNRGVGEMEQFQYAKAADEFRAATKKDPDWQVPRINLAIAILNLAEGKDPEVEAILREVLAKDPDNPHANYTLGFYLKHNVRIDEAFPFFVNVSRLDPADAYTWLHMGICHPDGEDSPAALACFKEALRLDPYLNAARYKLFSLARAEERRALLDELQRLQTAYWEHQYSSKYTDQGRYAQVIGRTPESHPAQPAGPLPAFDAWAGFRVELAAGTRWAAPADFGDAPVGQLNRRVRDRLGGTMVLFDYDKDDRPDVLLLSSVVRGGKLANLLLHNAGGGRFTDTTSQAGIDGLPPGLGCAVADFDNDDFRDLLITHATGVRLVRNGGNGQFTDVTATAGLANLKGVVLFAGWLDLDQDSDIDFVACRFGATEAEALDALSGKSLNGGKVEVWFNRGDAPAVPQGQRQPPLRPAFELAAGPAPLSIGGMTTGVVFTDLDADKDIDLLVLSEGKSPAAIRNDRLLRFSPIQGSATGPGSWNGGAVLDVNHDGQSDLLLLRSDGPPTVLLSKSASPAGPMDQWYTAGVTDSPPLRHAACVDLDADGWTDVIGLGGDRSLVFLHNDGQNRLVSRAAGLAIPAPADLLSVSSADLDADCHMDVLVWSESQGLLAFRGQDNGNKSLRLELSGRYELDRTRTNADGIGCRVTAQAGRLWTGLENTSLAAGLGQSRLPLTIGIGRASSADVVRILWPDATHQAAVGLPTCQLQLITEANRKPTSCPVLFVWDGRQFRYVTDFLGGGALGEILPDGSIRPPRPEESVKIEPELLVPKDGRLVLKVAEPMDEQLYLDRAELIAIDHRAGTQVHPDERFVITGPMPTQDLLVFEEEFRPIRATDHKGRDVLELLRERDQRYVDGFARRAWLGYAEEHFVELDFGDRVSRFAPKDRLFLVLAGWTDYAYPESIYAATQAGVPTTVPVLERLGLDGTWQSLGELGFPAGLPRVMTKEVTGLLAGPECRLRIRTNLSVYWDKIVVAPLAEVANPKTGGRARVTFLDVANANLAHRGFIREVRPQGSAGPIEYDDRQTDNIAVTPWRGVLTRLGDVTDLVRREDDCFVLCGPGDEVTLSFDASVLPPLPEGHVRSYVLRTWGYCKDTAPTTATGGRVEPLPFRGVLTYPHFTPEQRNRADAAQSDYRKRWNTRPAAGGPNGRPFAPE
jgi:tetratricopeptide (TPR) repeat protein